MMICKTLQNVCLKSDKGGATHSGIAALVGTPLSLLLCRQWRIVGRQALSKNGWTGLRHTGCHEGDCQRLPTGDSKLSVKTPPIEAWAREMVSYFPKDQMTRHRKHVMPSGRALMPLLRPLRPMLMQHCALGACH